MTNRKFASKTSMNNTNYSGCTCIYVEYTHTHTNTQHTKQPCITILCSGLQAPCTHIDYHDDMWIQ